MNLLPFFHLRGLPVLHAIKATKLISKLEVSSDIRDRKKKKNGNSTAERGINNGSVEGKYTFMTKRLNK